MSDQLRFTLLTASDAVTDAIAAGLLTAEDHPWYSSAGCHPAEEAMDADAKPMEPEFYRGWIARMAEALRLCADGRGAPMSVEYARKHKLPGAGVEPVAGPEAGW